MKIAVWRTGHEIADTVAEAVYEGLKEHDVTIMHTIDAAVLRSRDIGLIASFDIHIGYGILRGMDEVFRDCDKAGKPWFNIDKGYWKPGHYDGYYRISLRGTQQTFGLDKLKPDYERWDELGFEILEPKPRLSRQLVCPPTEAVEMFFGVNNWEDSDFICPYLTTNWREKGSDVPLQEDLDNCSNVMTFNSSVGWEALRQGYKVCSHPDHSIVGAYQKMLDKSIHDDSNARRELFALMAGLQLSLSEIKSGALWPLLQTLLNLNQKKS